MKSDHYTLDNDSLHERGSCPEKNPLLIGDLIGEQMWKPVAGDLRFVMECLEKELRPVGRLLLKQLYRPADHEFLIPPALVIFSGYLFSREIKHYSPAVYMALVYLGTMFHNRASVKDKNQQLYILTGDFLFSHLLKLLNDSQHLFLLERFADLITTMNEGFSIMEELRMEGEHPGREELIEIMRKQYGVFYGECCALGGLFAGGTEKEQSLLMEFGKYLGTAYGLKKMGIYFQPQQIMKDGWLTLSQLPASEARNELENFARGII
ncbi:MAG: class 1 isoprenoid biosynthesis enzyme [Thermacetogeniaceae bacterium]